MTDHGDAAAEQVAQWFEDVVAASDRIGDDLRELAELQQPLRPRTVERLRTLADRSEAALATRQQLGSLSVEQLFAGVQLWASRNSGRQSATLPLWQVTP